MNKCVKKNCMNKSIIYIAVIFSFIIAIAFAAFMPGMSVQAEGMRVSEDEKQNFENPADPFSFNTFASMFENEELKINGDLTTNIEESGLLISGKNKKVASSSITIRKIYDFGTVPQEGQDSKRTNRLMINAVAKYMTNTSIKLYLDEEKEPIAVKRIPRQSEKDYWAEEQTVFVEVPDSIYGEHYITLEISDVTTKEDKKTSVLLRGFKFYKESVPTVYVNIDEALGTIADMNSDPHHNTNCYGEIKISVPSGYKTPYTKDGSVPDKTIGVHSLEYIRGRGNSTWDTTKKPYKLKLDESEDLFGMGANKHWALIANYYDNSFIRNRITYLLGEKLEMAYSPRLIPVDVVMNGEYLGSYYLSEVVRVDKTRVDIPNMEKLTDEDIENDPDWKTGGFLLGMSPYGYEDGYQFTTKNGVSFVLESPEEMNDASPERLEEAGHYIEDYINAAEKAIYGEGFVDKDGRSYKEFIDLESAAKYYLMQMYTNNGDAYGTASTKLYKDKNGLLYFGPLWDFDYVAWGSYDYTGEQTTLYGTGVKLGWFERLKMDPEFIAKVREVWSGTGENDESSFKYQLKEIIKDGGIIDQYEQEIAASAENNYDKSFITAFPLGGEKIDNGYIPYEPEDALPEIVCNNYHEEIARLKNWIEKRIDWVDDYIENEISYDHEVSIVEFYNDGKLVGKSNLNNYAAIWDVPDPGKKEGYCFLGWYGEVEEFDYETEETYTREVRISRGDFAPAAYVRLDARWEKTENINAPEMIVFDRSDIYAAPYTGIRLKYSVLPEGSENIVYFESSDPEMLTVFGDGYVNINKKIGTATITATTVNGKKAEINIHVSEEETLPICSFNLGKEELTLEKGGFEKIEFNYMPEETREFDTIITNPDPEVAYMTETGVIVAVGRGTTTINVTVPADFKSFSSQIVVTVTDAEAEEEDAKMKAEEERKAAEEKAAKEAESKKKDETIAAKDLEIAAKDSELDTKAKDLKAKEDELAKKNEELNKKDADLKTKDAELAKSESEKKAAIEDKNRIIKKDTEFTYGKVRYTVTKACRIVDGKIIGGEVKVSGCTKSFKKKVKTFTTPDTVVMNGNTFTVTAVGDNAFKNCKKLKKITLGVEITKVGKNAFSGSRKLKQIKVINEDTTFVTGAFNGTLSSLKVYVPDVDLSGMKSRLNKAGIKGKQIKSY